MPRGFKGVREHADELERQRQQFAGGGHLFFKLDDRESAVVRFLEEHDDIWWARMHKVPVEGRKWPDMVPCLDQEKEGEECPGCEKNLETTFQGYINLIWFDAPVYERDDDNKIVKKNGKPVETGETKDQLAVWSTGIQVFDRLEELNDDYRGLRSRPFKIKRKGTGLSTKYQISPEDPDGGPVKFDSDEKAFDEEKPDLSDFVTPPEYDDFVARMAGIKKSRKKSSDDDDDDSGNSNGSGRSKRKNPFKR